MTNTLIFKSDLFKTLIDGEPDPYYQNVAVQNRFDVTSKIKVSLIQLPQELNEIIKAKSPILVELRFRRKDSSHGKANPVAVEIKGISGYCGKAQRGEWSEWVRIDADFIRGKENIEINNMSLDNFAIWDGMEIKVAI